MAKNYTTKTASLKAITIDVHKLEANNLKLNGEDVLQKIDTTKSELLDELDTVKQDILYEIDNAVPTVKISTDTRETITENDLWGTYVETKDNGEIVIHDDFISNPNADNKGYWYYPIGQVVKNKAYDSSVYFYANVETNKLTNGDYMFTDNMHLTNFDSNLSNLISGDHMFYYCIQLKTFTTQDLSSLTNGNYMFCNCSQLKSFNFDLSSLVDAEYMFGSYSRTGMLMSLNEFDSNLNSLKNANRMFFRCPIEKFNTNLPSVTSATQMFEGCSKLTTFTSDLSSLTNGEQMFNGCKVLTSFTSSLSSLENGSSMFSYCKLNPRSVMHIVETLPQRESNTSITIGIDVANDT